MSYFYSKSTQGFYCDSLHAAMPSDAVDVTDATYAALMTAQQAGQQITPDTNGNPIASVRAIPDPVPVTQVTPLQFYALFTNAEETAIYQAAYASAATNPALVIWLNKVSASTVISLTDPNTIANINALVTAGLLTAARAAQVLAAQAPPAS